MNPYEELMDPTGGSDRYEPGNTLPLIGMDLGLGMFGRYLMIGKSGVGGLYGAYNKSLNKSYGRRMNRIINKTADPSRRLRLGIRTRSSLLRDSLSGQRKFSRIGNSLRGLGLAAAGLGLLDFGLNIGMSIASPSVSRSALDRDKKLFHDEAMIDSRLAYTQRQRAIQAIHDSQMSVGRSLLGQEASYYHR